MKIHHRLKAVYVRAYRRVRYGSIEHVSAHYRSYPRRQGWVDSRMKELRSAGLIMLDKGYGDID